jgi:lysine 2,3-aminomutase
MQDHPPLPKLDPDPLARVAARYAVAITPAMAELMAKEGGDGPVTRQFAPDTRELDAKSNESADPIGDHAHEVVPGLIHRYPDRVLLKLVAVCAVYCRFCFRREMVGPEHGAPLDPQQLETALDYIRTHPQIWEVILSGGDPLVLSPRRIGDVSRAMAAIDHVKVVRWHTRMPVVDPERVTPELVDALRISGKAVWIAVHANAAAELTEPAQAACARFADAGFPLVGQTVLLAGVNDDATALEALFRAMVESRIKPYYLHHLDAAPGTAHFRIPVARGQALVRSLRGRLSGLAQPKYVLDIPGGHGKVPIGPQYLAATDQEGAYVVQDPCGSVHPYDEPVIPSDTAKD